jgi:membrane protease YdiL (CAAX protease family)
MAIGIPLLAWASSHFFGSKRFTRDLGWRIHWWDLPLGVAGAVAMWGLAIGVGLFAKAIGLPEGSNTDVIKDQMEQNPQAAFILMLFVLATAAILAPLSEELLFRGVLFRGLVDKVPMWAAVGIQGVIFGCAHAIPSLGAANIGLLMVLSSLGLCLGALAWLTGRLWSGIIAHALFNASNVILLYLSIKS